VGVGPQVGEDACSKGVCVCVCQAPPFKMTSSVTGTLLIGKACCIGKHEGPAVNPALGPAGAGVEAPWFGACLNE